MLVRIDMANGDILDYFKHLSKALIPDKKMVEELEDIYGESIGIEKESLNKELSTETEPEDELE